MTDQEYRTAIDDLGMSQLAAAKFLGVSDRQSRRYALGEYPVPEPVAKLLRLCVRLGLKPDEVK